MVSKDILQKIKKIELKTRKAVTNIFAGEYHSVFKGQGINFAEVREYQIGDDVRLIDWNVSARLGSPFIKIFEEERELTVLLLVDLSASGKFGSSKKTKIQIISEISALLGFSASANNDRVGLILFSDIIENYIPPKKGKKHLFRILRDIIHTTPKHKKTNINYALEYLLKTNKKKAIVFLISDFIDKNWEQNFKIVAKKHDLIPIIVEDPRDFQLPKVGLINLKNPETDQTLILNTNSLDTRANYRNIMLAKKNFQNRFFKSLNISPIRIDCSQNYQKPIEQFFKKRKQQQ